MLLRNDLSRPERKKPGRPPGSKNKVHDTSPEFAMAVLHEVANLPQHQNLTPNQIYGEAAREIYIRRFPSENLTTLRSAGYFKRYKMFLIREQERYDNVWFDFLDSLYQSYFLYCSDFDEHDHETEPTRGSPLSFESWSEAEMARFDHKFPPLPQGVTTKVARKNPSFRFPPGRSAVRRRR